MFPPVVWSALIVILCLRQLRINDARRRRGTSELESQKVRNTNVHIDLAVTSHTSARDRLHIGIFGPDRLG